MLPVNALPDVRVVRGPLSSGKTQRLVEHVAALVRNGVDPARVLVLCAAPWGIATMLRRLAAAGVPDTVRVSCPREIALQILAHPGAAQFVGRTVRVAPGDDADNLLGVCRGRPGRREKRQREMVRFFCRRWSELAGDDGQEWLLPGEEEVLHAVALRRLVDLDSVLRCEVSAIAVRFLRDNPAVKAAFSADYVVADDYLSLCRASQVLCCLMAEHGVYVAADEQASNEGCEDYPYAAGVEELVDACPDAQIKDCANSRQAVMPARVHNAVRAELGLSALPVAPDVTSGAVEELSFAFPQDEMRGAVARARKAVDEGVPAHDVCIACLHPVWRQALSRALEGTGVQVASARALTGRAPRVLIVCGFVEGVVFPLRYFDVSQMVGNQKEQVRDERLGLLRDVFGHAGEQLVVTRFERALPEEAQELGLRVGRVRMIDGVRTCLMDECEALGLVRAGMSAPVA